MAKAPKTFVMTIWPTAPTAIAVMPKIRLRGARKKTLPPYSPIRLGVKTAIVSPQNTDCTAFQTLILCIGLTRNFHFNASKNQLRSINRNTRLRVP